MYATGGRLIPTTDDMLGEPVPPGYPQSPRTQSAWQAMQSQQAEPPEAPAGRTFPVGGGYFIDESGGFVGEPPPWATSQAANEQRGQLVGPPKTAMLTDAERALQASKQPQAPTGAAADVGGGYGGGYGGRGRGNDEFAALFEQLAQKSRSALDTQQQGLDEMGRQRDAYAAMPTQVDLSPLMALADTWYGGNLQKGYRPPTTVEERVGVLTGLQQGLQKARGGLSESEIQALKDQIQGRVKLRELDLMETEKQLKRAQIGQANEAAKSFKEQKEITRNRVAFGDPARGTSAKLEALTVFKHSADEYAKLLEKHGGSAPSVTDPEYDRMQSLYQAMTLPWKDTGGLGALSGPDVAIIKGALGPQTFKEWMAVNAIRPGAALANIKKVLVANDSVFKRNLKMSADPYPKEHIADLVADKEQAYFGSTPQAGAPAGFNPDTATEEQLNQFLMGAH